ncbi:hypothetical protein HYDPIDRAFT_41032 [Hydnomerulius pinastri MD-312]|uniref:Uncharacterized protein n=1 Tax=Hydnomerulius pinastri MD-312 TaxID=994086 RepID=A0A0C9WE57_9AGAM|nr:hypothetical protein HYDPIDRAFT_41032 [Hydnomerulius pinastri MD-312]
MQIEPEIRALLSLDHSRQCLTTWNGVEKLKEPSDSLKLQSRWQGGLPCSLTAIFDAWPDLRSGDLGSVRGCADIFDHPPRPPPPSLRPPSPPPPPPPPPPLPPSSQDCALSLLRPPPPSSPPPTSRDPIPPEIHHLCHLLDLPISLNISHRPRDPPYPHHARPPKPTASLMARYPSDRNFTVIYNIATEKDRDGRLRSLLEDLRSARNDGDPPRINRKGEGEETMTRYDGAVI